jgi:hypothetical protein
VSVSVLEWVGGSLLTVLLLTTLTIGTWAALRTGKTAQTLANYKGAAESAQALAESLQAQIDNMQREHDLEVARMKLQLKANDERMHGQDLVIAELRDMITGAGLLDRLLDQQSTLRTEVLHEFQLTRQLISSREAT